MKTRLLIASILAPLLLAGAAPAAGQMKTAVFAGGCFWSVEKFFEAKAGVAKAVSGFSGGTLKNPTYNKGFGQPGHDGHLEVVQVTYDPAKVSYAQLVDHFFRHIDPTDNRGQFCDLGPSYRTAVFVANDEERRIAEATRGSIARALNAKVVTEVRGAAPFWPVGPEHQDFAKRDPNGRYTMYSRGCGRDAAIKAVWAGR